VTKSLKIWTINDLMTTKFPCMREVTAALKRYAAADLDAHPLYEMDEEEFKHLSQPVIWQGRQWAVTSYGVECLTNSYHIAASRLWEDEKQYGWVRQMAPKIWVDLCDFAEALRIARHTYREQHSGQA
jgi:hypothetical protein